MDQDRAQGDHNLLHLLHVQEPRREDSNRTVQMKPRSENPTLENLVIKVNVHAVNIWEINIIY